jgi:uncharacterized membrane protein YtjA (UPF0391 family)
MCARQFHAALEHRASKLRCGSHYGLETVTVLGWALLFFLLAIVAGYLGFFGLAGIAASFAKVLFLIFLVLLVVSFVARALRGKPVL